MLLGWKEASQFVLNHQDILAIVTDATLTEAMVLIIYLK